MQFHLHVGVGICENILSLLAGVVDSFIMNDKEEFGLCDGDNS
jgi:hypothetical protein